MFLQCFKQHIDNMAGERLYLRQRSRQIQNATYVVCVIGIFLSLYAYYVEISAISDKSFRAMCDISDSVSCSKVFTSRYGKGFGLLEYAVGKDSIINQPNSVFGILFYLLQIFCATRTLAPAITTLQMVTAVMANMGSVYLAYILVYILEDMCVVCVTTYIVNAALLICCVLKQKNSQAMDAMLALKKSS